MTKEKEEKVEKKTKKKIVGTRGKIFEGKIIKKFPGRVVIEFERSVYVKKYERFHKKKTRIHARLPEGINVELGDTVRVRECRPLSKIIHHKVIEKFGEKTQ